MANLEQLPCDIFRAIIASAGIQSLNEIVPNWLKQAICHILYVIRSKIYHFVFYMA